MQYLLTKEEYDALRNAALVERKKILEEVLAVLLEEFLKVPFRHNSFGETGASVRLSDMKAAVEKAKNRCLTADFGLTKSKMPTTL